MKNPSSFGDPQIKIAGLSLWIHGRQFPEIEDYWDGNWLCVTACCRTGDAEVWAEGPIVHLSEIKHWIEGCERMAQTLSGKAELACREPNLRVELKMEKHGAMALKIAITPDHLAQKHEFFFPIDQTYLTKLIRECQQVLVEYPLKGMESKSR